MSITKIIDALSFLGNFNCGGCDRRLVVDDKDGTVIKKHLVITDKSKGVVEIECRHCGHRNTIINNNN